MHKHTTRYCFVSLSVIFSLFCFAFECATLFHLIDSYMWAPSGLKFHQMHSHRIALQSSKSSSKLSKARHLPQHPPHNCTINCLSTYLYVVFGKAIEVGVCVCVQCAHTRALALLPNRPIQSMCIKQYADAFELPSYFLFLYQIRSL